MASSRRTRAGLLALAAAIGVTGALSLLLYVAVANHLLFFSHQRVVVSGQSMSPTLRDGQTATLDPSAYHQHGPAHGDLILFLSPAGGRSVKRVVAIPGDRIHIANGILYLNGQAVNEPYLPELWTSNNNWPADGRDVRVSSGSYFVLGDNRNHSVDSRLFGFIALNAIAGRIQPG